MSPHVVCTSLYVLVWVGITSEDFARSLREAVLGKSSDEVATVNVDMHSCLDKMQLNNFPHSCFPIRKCLPLSVCIGAHFITCRTQMRW